MLANTEMIRFLCLFLILSGSTLTGCRGQTHSEQTAISRPAWEDMAPSYRIENQRPMYLRGERRKTLSVINHDQSASGYELTLRTGKARQLSEDKLDQQRFWGWVGESPEMTRQYLATAANHVLELSLRLDGRAVEIPKEATIDLLDFRISRRNFLWTAGDFVYFYFEGADAGASYKGRFTIKEHRLIKREIWPGEFPEMGPYTTEYFQ